MKKIGISLVCLSRHFFEKLGEPYRVFALFGLTKAILSDIM